VPAIDRLRLKRRTLGWLRTRMIRWLTPELVQTLLNQPRVYGPPDRLHIASTAVVNDSLFNLVSGHITVGEWGMLAHGVSVLTGTHDVTQLGPRRQTAAPDSGRDVVIEEGAWLASNVTVIGPCRIGAHAVVAAGSLVRQDVAPYTIVAGVPARVVGEVPRPGLR
jgi:acetyltransferase-like isoleucine patch superfamily enzyme